MALKNKIFSNFKKRIEDKINNNEIPERDIDFNPPKLKDIYNNKISTTSHLVNNNIIDKYYNTRGNVSIISTMAGYIGGTNTASDVASNINGLLGKNNNLLSKLINIPLNNYLVKGTINTLLPSPSFLSGITIDDGNIKNQILSSEILIRSIPPPPITFSGSGENDLLLNKNIILNNAKSVGGSILTNLASSGKFNNYNIDQIIGGGINATAQISLARQGLRYTQAVGLFDNSPKKSSKYSGKISYNKYISDEFIDDYRYVDTVNINDENTSEIYNRYLNNAEQIEENKGVNSIAGHDTIESKFGYPIYSGKSTNSRTELKESTELDLGENYSNNKRDFVRFKFEDLTTSPKIEPIIFKATFSGLSDNVTSEWNNNRFMGRADQFYNYTGFTRDISFSFIVATHNKKLINPIWRKINRLYGLCYPTKYNSFNILTPPIVLLTIGNLYNKLYGKFSSIKLSPHDDSMWEIEEGKQLPQVVTIDVSFDVMYEGNIPPQTNMNHFNNKIESTESKKLILVK